MPPSAPEPRPAAGSALRFHTREVLRFGDQDSQGHVNNAVYSTLFESGRVAFQTAGDGLVPGSGQAVVLASITIDFLRELHWPGTVDLRLGISQIGRSSFGFAQEMWRGDVLVARARSTQVVIDRATRRPTPLSDGQRRQLEPWLAR